MADRSFKISTMSKDELAVSSIVSSSDSTIQKDEVIEEEYREDSLIDREH